MAYLDRLREGRYTTPSGNLFVFEFSSLERSGEKKAAIHELPQQNTPEVQDLGNKAQRFPITAIFSDANYDITADAFAAGLSEKGAGFLQHPRWGDMQALPLTWKQSEDFVDGMGRATFEIEFLRIDETRFPISSASLEGGLKEQLDTAQAAASASFVISYGPVNAADLAACKKGMTNCSTDILTQLKEQIAADADLASDITGKVTQFNATIDTLAADPQAMADSILEICRLPGTVDTGIRNKIDSYSAALSNTIAQIPESISQSAGVFLRIFGISSGVVESSLVGSLTDRSDAVAAAQAVQDALALAQTASESAEVTGYFVPADVLAQVRAMMAAAAALLLEKAFSLRTARKLVLQGDRTPLDLIYELAKPADGTDLEGKLDEFITQNRLGGEMLLVIPAGTEVSFYA